MELGRLACPLTGVRGTTLTELGFDVRDDGHCGAGTPRMNVRTMSGDLYFFTCYWSERTPIADQPGWTRVRFSDVDAWPQYETNAPWPGFGSARIVSIEMIFDEGTDQGVGWTVVDEIDVSGMIIHR